MNNLEITIENYVIYCQNQKRLDRKTLKTYRIDLKQFSNQIMVTEAISITSQILENFIAELYITPHMFCHTFATSLLEADIDIRYIQEMLGHSSIHVTEIYTHVAVSKQRENVIFFYLF